MISATDGTFSTTFKTSALPASVSPYRVGLSYPGGGKFGAGVDFHDGHRQQSGPDHQGQ